MKEEEIIQAANKYVGHAEEAEEDLSTYCNRKAFEAGAKWMQEKMIEKACEWLNKTINSDIDGYAPNYPFDKMINDFEKAMEQ